MKNQFNNHRAKANNRGFLRNCRARRPVEFLSRITYEAFNSIEVTLLHTNGSLNGLIESDAADRLRSKGKNEVAHDKAPHAFVQLAYAFRNPFVVILLVLAGISYCTDVYFASSDERDWNSVIILLVMVIVSSLLRFFQEYRSNRAAERLKSMVCSTATVVRRTSKTAKPVRRKVLLSSLVVGDIVDLQAGDMIPADVRLIDSRNFMVSQAALTGEALPVEKYDTLGAVMQKSATRISKESRDPLELPNICFMGTNVFSGSATAVVVETGANTYFGTLAKIVISRKRIETSFDRGVNSVSWLLIRFMLVMVPVVFLLNGVTKGDWLSALTFALAVAVGLTPEMLPMIVSANLAKGAIAMSRRKVVVKRLNSVQNFGAMDVLCTDKTGTLTQDRIILEHHLNVNGVRDDRILEFAWLNSFHQRGQKNCMDMAIVEQAEKSGLSPVLNRYRKVDELPFDFERRRVSVVLEHEAGSQLMVCKGAVEEMLDVCTSFQEDSGVRALDQFERAALLTRSQVYNEQGYRVLLIATREIPPDDVKTHFQPGDERELVVRGLLTFLDPPKDSAALAIRALNEHRISVKVLTGDNPIVTAKVCRDVGLEPGTPLLGRDIEDMTDTELDAAVERTTVFAKLTPLQKSRVVNAFQANGHTVGFLGDGINDAAALRDADVGISVDTGSDIAKETADIILLEKDLMVLEQGVITGRQTFGNILKYLNMTASSNFGNVFSVLIASAFLPWEPMLAVQLLIQNLIYDLSQMFLPWDKMDSEFLAKPRKWEAGNIRRFMIWFGPTSSVFDITTFWLLWTVFGAGATYYANGGGQIIMNSGWFVEGLVSQTLVVHMLRTQRIPFFQSMAALPVMLSTTVAIFVACWLPYSPFAQALGFQALDHRYWGWLIATIVAYMLLAQAVKTVYIRRYRRWY